VVEVTVMVAHTPVEGISLEKVAGFPELYKVPVAEVDLVERETEPYLWWVIVLGFVAYAIALYWAHRCNRRGGDPSISFGLRGFVVRCYR
jgi:sterol desaturase/sphingolipid hydroxylase (fatty acid hydroxylase superfamily)